MFLYLVRHAEAQPENVDPERRLSDKGMLEASEIAAFMNCAEVKADEIWHSPKERAKRTAIIISEAIPHKNMVEREGLKSNDPPAKIAEEISEIHENIMIVGHLPFLEKLASFLMIGEENKPVIKLGSAGAVCLEKWEEGWSASWLMSPELISQCLKHQK